MDFFEKLKSGASGVGKQAQVMIEITRINSQIGEKQAAIRSKMETIGREVYDRYASGGNWTWMRRSAGGVPKSKALRPRSRS